MEAPFVERTWRASVRCGASAGKKSPHITSVARGPTAFRKRFASLAKSGLPVDRSIETTTRRRDAIAAFIDDPSARVANSLPMNGHALATLSRASS
jgi:hypothetical protein